MPKSEGNQYSGASWGVGVVVPDGAGLSGGAAVSWASTRNLTAVVQIPSLVNVTAVTYAIVSLMTQDGFVLQAAVGVYPGNSTWLAYSMFIAEVKANPQTYHWVLNSSLPRMYPGDKVAISIFLSQTEGWSFMVRNLDRGSMVQQDFGAGAVQAVRSGDQEVFALESYARDAATFEKMGNLTLVSVMLDGRDLVGGWYSYGDWDARHNPLVVVGGATPPQFIAFTKGQNALGSWTYRGGWSGVSQEYPFGAWTLLVVTTVAAVAIGAVAAWRFLRNERPEAEPRDGEPSTENPE
ncbi:MAG: hypothetical protein OK438_03680 [Thaumarchaeota archaeon]|nr:hypothetical protein [Nitrososphaerota archaeon]